MRGVYILCCIENGPHHRIWTPCVQILYGGSISMIKNGRDGS